MIISSVRLREAESMARDLLGPIPERLRHSAAVADEAQQLSGTVDEAERGLLVAAAWLHDIGYAPALRDTSFHPLDGARHLAAAGWPRRLNALVAHHSGARFVAHARGLDLSLAEFPFEDTALMDALTYADQTRGPNGTPMAAEDRIRDMLTRHGPQSPNARAHHERGPYLQLVAERVQTRMRAGL